MASAPERVALVTGASSGFGLHTSVELARRGFRVFGSMRNLDKASVLLETARAEGVYMDTVQLDVTDAASIREAVAEVEARAGSVDVLVNNAGIGLGGFFEDTSEEELRRVMETNFFGAAAVIRAVLPGMRGRKFGRIINISSVSGRMGAPGFSAYASSKWALEAMSEALRNEVLPFGIHVVLVEPGMFKTDIFGKNRQVAEGSKDERSPYAKASRQLEAQADGWVEKLAGDPRVVAKLIASAAKAKHPKLRYLVGPDARAAVFARAVAPERVMEWFYRRTLDVGADE